MTAVKKDYTWNTIGVFLQNATSPLLLLVVTRVNGIDGAGEFSFAFSVAIVLWVIAMWGGRTYQVSDLKNEFSYAGYLASRYLLSIIVFVFSLLFALINQYDGEKTTLIFLLVIFKVIEAISDVVYGVMQHHDKLHISGKSLTIKAVLGFISFVVIDTLTGNLLYATTGVIAANIVVFAFCDRSHVVQNLSLLEPVRSARIYKKQAIRILRRTLPAFSVAFLATFSLNIPRYFLDKLHPEQIGYFGIIAMPVTLVVLVMTFILQPNFIELSRFANENDGPRLDKVIKKILKATAVIGFGILIATYVIGVEALALVFGKDFSDYKISLVVLVAGAIFNALIAVFITVLIIMRRFGVQVSALLVTNIMLTALSHPIIAHYGTLGAVSLFSSVSFAQATILYICYTIYIRKLRIVE